MKGSKVENLLIDICVQFYVVLFPTNAVYSLDACEGVSMELGSAGYRQLGTRIFSSH